MKIPNSGRKALLALVALLVFASVSTFAIAAPAPQDSKGGVRADDGQPLRVTVLLNGKPWAKAAVVITKADGTPAVSGVTATNGTYTTNSLSAGVFSVSASTTHYSASSNITLVKSTETAFLKLTLAKKPTAVPVTTAAAPAK